MILGKKFNMRSAQKTLDWSYEHYLQLLDSTKSMTYSLTPTITLIEDSILNTFNRVLINNNVYLIGMNNNNSKIHVFNTATLTTTQIAIPINIGTNTKHPLILADGRIVLISNNDIYIADDVNLTNILKKLTMTGLTSSSHGLSWTTDYNNHYLYVWYNETSKMAKIDLTTYTASYFLFPSSQWLYNATVLPDDSICFATISLEVYKYSGATYQTVKNKSYGSYAGWAQPGAIIDDKKIMWGIGARDGLHNYINFDTLESTSTINLGNSDYVGSDSVRYAIIGYDNILIFAKPQASISSGLYMYHPIKGSINKLNVSSDIISKLSSNQTYMTYIGKGRVLIKNTSDSVTCSCYLVDFHVNKYMDDSSITSPWFGNSY